MKTNEKKYKKIKKHIHTPRFLHNGYQQALKLAQPDLILFMGDLLDEGSIANDVQFEQYVDRFYKIFDTPTTIQVAFKSL